MSFHVDHAALSVDEKLALDAMDHADIQRGLTSPFGQFRLYSFYGRCRCAYTMGRTGTKVDADFVRSLIPRINASHAADFEQALTPAIRYAYALMDKDERYLVPLKATDFTFSRVEKDDDVPRWNFIFVNPITNAVAHYWPTCVYGPF